MIDYVTEICHSIPNTIVVEDKLGNLYATKGFAETYPCVVGHLDTVHRIIPVEDYLVVKDKDVIFAIDRSSYSRTGIGGDDNVGIFIALEILRAYDNVKVAFFVDEEVGCQGSSSCDMSFFDDVSLVFQADSQGYTDIVNEIGGTSLYGDKFSKAISGVLTKYNKKEVWGGMTDVQQLAESGLDVCVLNCSCGYYSPHSDREYVKINEVLLTLFLFQDIIDEIFVDGEKWSYKRLPKKEYGYNAYGSGYNDYDYYANIKENEALLTTVKEEEEDDFEAEVDGNVADLVIAPTCSLCDSTLDIDHFNGLGWCHNCQQYDYNYRKQ